MTTLVDRRAASSSSSPRGSPTARQAERIFLAAKTIKNYVSSFLAKLGMERRTQTAVYGARIVETKPPQA